MACLYLSHLVVHVKVKMEGLELQKDKSVNEEPMETLIHYEKIYIKYIKMTNRNLKEENIKNQIKN